ncbi:MAG: SEC-C metal-binding domain-containing protein [Pseudomonadales bacterium]|nr:SEC-C metal-binding domain-containing protein [Pseudomonadales bacterium]MDG2035296.1 SEC-C metal-binding domain-containing protein [Pseudomonadales bacterium]
MSDKFFFKGRQDARQNHTNHGYQTNAVSKAGSKKYPLQLVVTTDERKQEVERLVGEADLYAEITLDKTANGVESIAELTALLNKASPVVLDKTPARNDPCYCGSGKKYKKCCA